MALLAAGSAAAQEAHEPQRFGTRGQLVLNGDLRLQGGYSWATNDTGRDNGFFGVQPSLDYFVVDGLSLGTALSAGGNFGDQVSATQFGAGLRVGYALPLAERLSLWPRLGALLYTQNVSVSSGFGQEDDDRFSYLEFELFAPALLHLTPGLFLGLDPALSLDVEDLARVNLGVHSLIGGHF